MIPDLFNILDLKLLRWFNEKQGAIKGIHATMPPAAGYTGTIFTEAKKGIFRVMSV